MKILIMGAGYVGMTLLRQLQNQGYVLYASTTQEERIITIQPYVEKVILLNNSNQQLLQQTIEECDALIILIAPKNHEDYEKTYLNTAKMITNLLETREKPLYLLYTSSTSVYEGAQTEWSTENDVLNPQSQNAKILIEAEKTYLSCPNSHVISCILRLGGIYGPNRDLAQRAQRLSGKEMPGTGNESTNHIHLDDIVSGIEFCLEKHLSGIYNLVNDEHPSRKELYTHLCDTLNIAPPRWNNHVDSQRNGGYKVSSEKIKRLGFMFGQPFTGISLCKNSPSTL